MLRIIMFKNLGFERLRITSPRLYLTKVKQNNFKKTGGYDPSPPPPPPPGGGVLQRATAVPTCRFQAIEKK